MEFYFGNSNYNTDDYLKNLEANDGWIDLKYINDFRKMKKFRLSLKDVSDMMKLSTVVDVDERDAFGDGERMLYFIRKRAQEMKEDVAEIFGFDIETVKQLNKEQFEIFI